MNTSGISSYNQYLISGAPAEGSSTSAATGTPTKDNPFLGNTNWDCANLLKLINDAQKIPTGEVPAEEESTASSTVTASMSSMIGF